MIYTTLYSEDYNIFYSRAVQQPKFVALKGIKLKLAFTRIHELGWKTTF